ncbi:D-alanyl-D-alanine carboxypeptidase/D-alanyl-D-alanine-endopeptidase [Arthrobacter sp. SX1312]|uniref:D-alanyl-D-alanine carboxypeptidase/D-alanyl-D-alanine endopeptidase n=1 Tax=Arthrobacter sp. SX1312 TaxID=2058896 RepID=UPI000CE46F12|nr:D-alanyl-D-alanine carboxypeptidase/D-alanyl-D-alanine-endopeptidase [Arthrobacter sp. SX1312]
MIRRLRRTTAAAAALMLVAAGATACTAGPAPAGDTRPVSQVPDAALEVMNQQEYANGRWQITATDIETGEVLIDLDGAKMAEPGSFVKTYSVGAAWLTWGPDHTLTTPVKRVGEVVDAALQGDLVLVGKGDLTMGGRTKPDGTVDFTNLDHNDANPLPGATLTPEDPLTGLNELATQVKASGIDSVSGEVVVDDRLFAGELAGEPITPIIINQNILDLQITPGEVGEPATVELTPAVEPWRVVSDIRTVAAGEQAEVTNPESAGGGEIVISGTIAADSDPQLKVLVLEDPATFARTAFIEALGRAGVSVDGDPTAGNSTATLAPQADIDALPSVAELESLPLAEEATYVMKISYNRGAQTFVCLLAVETGKDDCSTGMSEAGRIWKDAGLDITGASLIDGSGLDGNYITAENAVQIQTIMADRPDAERWRDTLPILGVDGSLSTVQADSPAAGKVFAKTGTLAGGDSFNGRLRLGTKTLGGVMETESGRTVAFTIIMNQGFADDIDGVFKANDDVGAVAAAIQQGF